MFRCGVEVDTQCAATRPRVGALCPSNAGFLGALRITSGKIRVAVCRLVQVIAFGPSELLFRTSLSKSYQLDAVHG